MNAKDVPNVDAATVTAGVGVAATADLQEGCVAGLLEEEVDPDHFPLVGKLS